MNLILTILSVLIVFNALLLIGVILLQSGEDEQAYGTLGGNNVQNILGAAHAPNLLEKITRVLAAFFLVLILSTSYLIKRQYDAEHSTSSEVLKEVEDFIEGEE